MVGAEIERGMAEQAEQHLKVGVRRGPGLLARLQARVAERSRRKRAELFFKVLDIRDDARVLDLGGARGVHFARHYGRLTNVCIADRDPAPLRHAAQTYGYQTLLLDDSARLPLADGAFDVIFCSSVVEHVTGPRDQALALFKQDGRRFAAEALTHQTRFANEIRRCAKAYFVQTPYRYFPIEVHCWIPFVGYLPTHLQWRVISLFNRFWPRRIAQPDWSLLTAAQMRRLFPDAELHRETVFGFTKSLIAIRRAPASSARMQVEAPGAAAPR